VGLLQLHSVPESMRVALGVSSARMSSCGR
jgi:hypothetical protein